MGWWLRAIVSACFAAAALFVVALWVRSHWTFDRLSAPLAPRRTLILISYRGSVTATLAELHIPEVWRDSGRSHPIGTRTPDMIWPRERVLGFAGAGGSGEEQFAMQFGVAYFFGGKAASPSVTGQKGLPLLDVANNGSFLITD